jgi:hypothetical protein
MEPAMKIAALVLMNALAGVAAWRAGRALGGARWTDAALGACAAFFSLIVAVTAVAGFSGALTAPSLLCGAAIVFAASLAIPRRALTAPVPPRISLSPAPIGFFLSSRRPRSRAF